MRRRRFVTWALSRIFGGSWSPSLAWLGLRPTLAWAWSGRHADLAGQDLCEVAREAVELEMARTKEEGVR